MESVDIGVKVRVVRDSIPFNILLEFLCVRGTGQDIKKFCSTEKFFFKCVYIVDTI